MKLLLEPTDRIESVQGFDLVRIDSGCLRVYFRPRGRRAPLYCIQNEGGWGIDRFVWLICSSDGEPSHEVKGPDGWQQLLLGPHRKSLSLKTSN